MGLDYWYRKCYVPLKLAARCNINVMVVFIMSRFTSWEQSANETYLLQLSTSRNYYFKVHYLHTKVCSLRQRTTACSYYWYLCRRMEMKGGNGCFFEACKMRSWNNCIWMVTLGTWDKECMNKILKKTTQF